MADLIGKYISTTDKGINQSSKESSNPSITLFSVEGCQYLLFNRSIESSKDSPETFDTSYVPDPILCCEQNSILTFSSPNEFSAHVDYGDGYEEDIQATKAIDKYVFGWRSLDIEYMKDPASSNGGWTDALPGGGYYIPRPNYKFKDGSQKHKIIITFNSNSKITNIYSIYNQFSEFPIIQLTELESFSFGQSKISNINWKRLLGMKNLLSLVLGSAVNYRSTIFPEELFQMKNLTTLHLEDFGRFDTEEAIESSNIRKFKNLINLRVLNLFGNFICKYIKEFNELKSLTLLRIGSGTGTDISNTLGTPNFSEVDKIELPRLEEFSFMQRYGDGNSNDVNDTRKWGEEINGKLTNGMNLKLYGLWTNCSTEITELPEYLQNSRIKEYYFPKSFQTVERVNKFVDLVYDATVKSTMNSSNVMWGKKYTIFLQAQPWAKRPSGEYQAPEGFIKGSNNGTPTSQMEKVYVLVNNYNCVFTLAPDSETSKNLLANRIKTLVEENELDYCIIPEFSAYNVFPEKLYLFYNSENDSYWISQTIDDCIYPEDIVSVSKFDDIDELSNYLKKNNLENRRIIESWEETRKDELKSAIYLAEQNREKIKVVARKLKGTI